MADKRRSSKSRHRPTSNKPTTQEASLNNISCNQVSISKWKALNEVKADCESGDGGVSWNAFSPPSSSQYGEKTPILLTQPGSLRPFRDMSQSEISPSIILGCVAQKKRSTNILATDNPRRKNFGRHDSMEEVRSSISALFRKDKKKGHGGGSGSSLPVKLTSTTAESDTKPAAALLNTSLNKFPDDEWDDELVMASQTAEEYFKNSSLQPQIQGKAALVETPKRNTRRLSKESNYRDKIPENQKTKNVNHNMPTILNNAVTNKNTPKRKPSLHQSVPSSGPINKNDNNNINMNDIVASSDNDISLFEKSQISFSNCKPHHTVNPKCRKTTPPVVPSSQNEQVKQMPKQNNNIETEVKMDQVVAFGEFDDEDDSFLSQLVMEY